MQDKFMKKPVLQDVIKKEKESDNEEENEIALYADHEIKQEMDIDVIKKEKESNNEEENEIASLYANHEIKQEVVIGPEVIHKPIYNLRGSKDDLLCKKPKHNGKINQEDPQKETKEISTKKEIMVSDTDVPLHKKPRLHKQDIGSSSNSEDGLLVDRNPPPEKKDRIDDKEPIWDLERRKFVKVSEFMGKWYVDIRQFYEKNGELFPSKTGMCLTPEQWRRLLSVADEINKAVSSVCADIENFGGSVRQYMQGSGVNDGVIDVGETRS